MGLSLTGYLNYPVSQDVRNTLRQHLTFPDLPRPRDIRHPNIIQGAGEGGILGPAFDYLTRFHLLRWQKEQGRATSHRKWHATLGVDGLEDQGLQEKASEQHQQDLLVLDAFIQHGGPAEPLLEVAVRFAHLEIFDRTGRFQEHLFELPPRVLGDLRQLLPAIHPGHFPVQERLLFNPVFPSHWLNLSGADGDLIIDDTLIEIKATNKPSRTHFLQLLLYVLLDDLAPQGPQKSTWYSIERVAVYYPRFDTVIGMNLHEHLRDREGLTFYLKDQLLNWEDHLAEREAAEEAQQPPPLSEQARQSLEASLQTITSYRWFRGSVGKTVTVKRVQEALLDHMPEYLQLGNVFHSHVRRITQELQAHRSAL